jgi:signal transduction histidine kinase
MLRALLARLRPGSRDGNRPDRVQIIIPLLIMSAALGVLAWRSYSLSLRMERGANTLAAQYAGYAAEVTARRVDGAMRTELSRAVEDWQQVERFNEAPTVGAIREWVAKNEWIVFAIYVPDYDPASSVVVSELGTSESDAGYLTQEFFTSSGTVRYKFDPARLLARAHNAIKQQPQIRTGAAIDTLVMQQPADVTLVPSVEKQVLVRLDDGFAFYSPLGAPLSSYAVRAAVRPSYVGSGWANQRVVSLWVSLIALILMIVGVILAVRGLGKEAEAMKLRSALIANVSHELRTPLSMIRLGAETLKRGSRLKEQERQEIEDQILREVLHLSHLVENVLDVARIQHRAAKAMAFVPVEPRDLVTTLVSTYQSWIRSKGFEIKLHIDEEIEAQLWDRDAVSRALLNLIDNAIKYSADERSVEVFVRSTQENVIIEVKDRGIGISQRDLTRIFDPYFRAQFSDTQTRRGAGLGLTLVQQIVASHEGRVEVESQPGSGSTFRMVFPRMSPQERVAMTGLMPQSKPITS